MLARELAEKIRSQTTDSLTGKMHVHVKGVPRKQEIEELQKSEQFREALAKALSEDALYQDCITVNMQPGSLLVARYKEDEEAFDAVADNCTRRIISAARKYTAKKEKMFLKKYDIDADRIAALIPFSGQVVTHYNVRAKKGLKPTQPIIDEYAPLFFFLPDCPPILIVSGDRNLELYGRYEETAYFWRLFQEVGHKEAYLYELDGFDHGAMVEPGCHILKEYVKKRFKK